MAIPPKPLPIDTIPEQWRVEYHLLTAQSAIINRITQAISGTLVVDEVLHSIALQLLDTLEVNGCLIFPTHDAQLMASSWVSVTTPQADGKDVPQERLYGVCQEFYQYYHSRLVMGAPVFRAGLEPGLPRSLQDGTTECGIWALLIVPMLYRQSYIGGITLYQREQKREWLPQEIAFVQAIAAQCAIALTQRDLELRAEERTAALREANHILREEIIERKRVEKALRESEERFRQAVVNAPFPIMIHAEGGEILQINQIWTELTGYTQDEIPTMTDWSEKAAGEYSSIRPMLALESSLTRSLIAQRYDPNNSTFEGEFPVRTKDGTNRIWNFSSAPLGYLSDGRRITISMATDITERTQAESEVRFLHSVTQAIFASQDFHAALSVAIQKVCESTGWDFGEAWVPRPDNSVLECSPAWFSKTRDLEPFRSASETLTFFPGMGLPGRVWVSQQPEWRRNVSVESNEVYLRAEIARKVGLKAGLGIPLLAPKGVIAVLVFYMFESKDEDERLIELISASTELGLMIQRKQAEGEIRKALEKEKELTELKSRFISMTSHEFRTPLTTIQSSAELLENYSHRWTEEKKLSHLLRIQTSVEHMTTLLNDVLILGKAEAGKLEFNPAPLDLENFCRNLVEELQLNDTDQHTIRFQVGNREWGVGSGEGGQRETDDVLRKRSGSTHLSYCKFASASTPLEEQTGVHSLLPGQLPCMDEKLLRQILENLLNNAIKYSPASSTVEFILSGFSNQVVFQICDRGIGIPMEDQKLLFETFHRASNVGTIAGTGLGLAIVKRCVDIHQGQIVMESEVGVGTTFTVTLPIYNSLVS